MGVDPTVLELPSLSGNPFEIRPLSIGQAQDLIGRDEIVIECREHLISGSPRMVIISGVRGSGRTSILNAVASQSSNPFISDYWPMDNDPVKNMVTQVAAHFIGHNLPSVISETITRLSEELDNKDGPIPLVAFDLPYNVDVSTVIPRLVQIMQKMRALVLFTMLPGQLSSLEEDTLEIFDPPYSLRNLTADEIQLLVDKRIARVARQRWIMHSQLIENIHDMTEGIPRAVVRTLRDLVDERRGIRNRSGTLERLFRWSEKTYVEEGSLPITEIGTENEQVPEVAGAIPSIYEYGLPQFNAVPDASVELESEATEQITNEEIQDSLIEPKHSETELEFAEELTIQENMSPMQETNNLHSPDRDGYFWMEPGTEPPPITVTSLKSSTTGSFKGLAERTVSTHFEMPKGGDGTKIIDADRHAMNNFEDSTRILIEPSLVPSESNQSIDDSPVLSTEQAVWTVGEDFEATLPPPVENTQQEQTRHDPIGLTQGLRSQPMPPSISFDYNLEPNWDDSAPLQHSYLSKLNEAEKLILTVSSVREISPSDPELQARLEVGRPRLSQLFNELKRNGFLKVRKEGRTRFFKLTEEAFDVLR